MTLPADLRLLKEAGFAVPENALNYAEDRELEERGVKQVWECKPCKVRYESSIKINGYTHNCGKNAKKVWPRS